MPRAARIPRKARQLTGHTLCECIFARNLFEKHPCDLSLDLPDGHVIDLKPRQYVRLKVGGEACPNSHDFDIPVEKHRIVPGTGYIVFQENIEDKT